MQRGDLKMSVSKLICLVNKVEQYLGHHSIKDAKIMFYLFDKNEITPCLTIIKELELSPVMVTRSLKFLIDSGVVTMCMDTIDTRKKSVALTDRGKAFKLEILELMEEGK